MAASRRKRQKEGAALALCISIILVGLALGSALLLVRGGQAPGRPPAQPYIAPLPPSEKPGPDAIDNPDVGSKPGLSASARTKPDTDTESQRVESAKKPKLVFVIDDAGHNLWQLEPFLQLPFPLTIAVLPGLAYTQKAAALIVAAGKELILHQPMEALNGLDAGPGSISQTMPPETIRQILTANMAQLPQAVGMNNHMGSKATAHAGLMGIVLDTVRQAGWYFLDSGTTADSVVATVAAKQKLSIWERTVFLDNSPERDYIVNKINEGSKVAAKHGYAIMIGHVWTAELAQTLSELYPALIEQGFSLSTIAKMIMEKEDADPRH